ncbi:unnamed protein product [Allacma fusca]|uniref:Uncharacterized protein n=1 Tax=Allacma fusca TaxID=39272 RepID=A0A8J2LSY3_9HEXA|nr:unnamed protein product [Allacma fusca]
MFLIDGALLLVSANYNTAIKLEFCSENRLQLLFRQLWNTCTYLDNLTCQPRVQGQSGKALITLLLNFVFVFNFLKTFRVTFP